MLTCLAGPTHTYDPGHEYDLPTAEAKRLIAAGFAVPAVGREIETATVEPLETREVKPHAGSRKNRADG